MTQKNTSDRPLNVLVSANEDADQFVVKLRPDQEASKTLESSI